MSWEVHAPSEDGWPDGVEGGSGGLATLWGKAAWVGASASAEGAPTADVSGTRDSAWVISSMTSLRRAFFPHEIWRPWLAAVWRSQPSGGILVSVTFPIT